MKKMILLTMLLLAIVSGQVFAANKVVSVNFAENTNQVFSGGQLIGPYATDSSNWNNSGANIPSGSMLNLIDSEGDATGIDVEWSSANCWYNGDGTADDEHKIAVGYLDDGSGVTITLTNIPYANYKIVGLYTSGQGDTATVNFDVNGTWALGGDAATIADAYGSINSCNTNTGSYWTQIDPGVTRGNYWVVDTTGATCTITGELRNDTSRGSLAGIIIETDEAAPIVQRSISTNFQSYESASGWGKHWYLSRSSNPTAGYVDPNGILPSQQIPSATWNEGIYIDDTYLAKDYAGSLGSSIAVHSGNFEWHTSWYQNVDGFFAGSIMDAVGGVELEDAKNKYRVAVGFIGFNGNTPRNEFHPLTTIKKNPYSDYTVVTYMHPNRTGDQQGLQIEDQAFYYLNQHGADFQASLKDDPNDGGWLMATETTGPATTTANIAIFRDLSEQDMTIFLSTPSNSGVSAYSIISNIDGEDIVTQILPGNINKDYGGTPASITTDLTWNAPVNGADSYDVYLSVYGDEDPNLYLVESGNTTGSYTPTLKYNTVYVWKVDTVRGGETISGDYFYFDTEGDPLLQVQPNSVSVKAGSDTFFTVGVLLVDNYEWWFSADAAVDTPEDDIQLQSGPDATVNVLNAEEGVNTGYYYVILTNTIPDSVSVTSDVASLEIGKLEVYLPFGVDPNDVFLDASGNGWNADYGNVGPDPSDPNLTVPTMGEVSIQTGYDGVGQAVKFTRDSGDVLVIPGSEDYFNFYPKGFTIRFWVKPTYGVGGFMTYIAKGNSGWRMLDTAEYYGQGFEAKMYPLGRNTSPQRLDDGNWHMVACTYDAATQEMKVYQEGFLDGTVTGALNDASGNTNPISIGSYNTTGTGGWSYEGLIDDVEIFSYAVSERDMLEDYATKTGEVYCLGERVGDIDDDCQVGASDLAIVAEGWLDSTIPGSATPEQVSRVVSWQFDETDGLVATDSSGNGIDGILGAGFTGGQWIVDGGRTGNAGDNALYLNGDPNTSVIATVADPGALPTGNIFLATSSWTINLWVKFEGPAAMVNIAGFGDCESAFADRDNPLDPDRYFVSFDGGLEFETGSNEGFWPGSPLHDGQWKMLTATFDSTTQFAAAYLNGVSVGSKVISNLADCEESAFKVNSLGEIIWEEYGAARTSMNGYVDDYSVWAKAFNAEQVAGMYANSFPSCDGAVDGDVNGDCVANLADFAIVAADWLDCDLVPGTLCD